MKNQHSALWGLLPPILISILSIAGIAFILLTSYLNKPKTIVSPTSTATPFKFLFIATETEVAEQDAKKFQTTPIAHSTASNTNIDSTPSSAAIPSSATASSNPIATQTTPSPTASATLIPLDEKNALPAGKYDDTDQRFIYDGDWSSESLISGAFQETISYSTTTGSTVSFTFAGKQIKIGYLGESDLGILLVTINDNEYTLDQSNGAEWSSPMLPYGVYAVVLTHEDGDQILFDYLNVIGSP